MKDNNKILMWMIILAVCAISISYLMDNKDTFHDIIYAKQAKQQEISNNNKISDSLALSVTKNKSIADSLKMSDSIKSKKIKNIKIIKDEIIKQHKNIVDSSNSDPVKFFNEWTKNPS